MTPPREILRGAMSQENVEMVRRAVDAFNARDEDRLLSLVDPEVEFRSAIEQTTYRGREGLVQYRDDIDAVMQEFRIEGERFLDAGGDRVVHLYRIVAGTGVPVTRDVAALWELRSGKILKGRVYLDPTDALQAAGLRE